MQYLARYQDLARDLDINIVPGTVCEVHPVSGSGPVDSAALNEGGEKETKIEIRNMAYWISAGTGTIAGAYQKKNLWHPERPHLTAGTTVPHAAFDTPLTLPSATGSTSTRPLRAGLLICWDLAFPEAFRSLIASGADMVVIPSYWHLTDVDATAYNMNPMCEKVFLDAAVVARAYENTCCVVFCNAGGRSQVAVPILGSGLPAVGTVLGTEEEGDGNGVGKEEKGPMGMGNEEMRVVEVDLGVLGVAEGNYKVREDMKGDGWHYGYTLWRG